MAHLKNLAIALVAGVLFALMMARAIPLPHAISCGAAGFLAIFACYTFFTLQDARHAGAGREASEHGLD